MLGEFSRNFTQESLLAPGAVGEAVEIDAGTDALVHVSGLDAMIRCHSVLRFKFAVET